ncbi:MULTISPECIES: hypothetical protein [unclassified Xanthobacter]|uniref:hypothetical protein n=1 Tax=unclassified Xanthobacter TaxID=2623496 RepID=UPI001F3C37C2|nr:MULTISPECIES: hypothetical protein [unclassified Xanthobacter]
MSTETEAIREEAARHLKAFDMRRTVEGVDTLAELHGLKPYAGRKGAGVWECWADRVLEVAICPKRAGEEELASRKAEADTYSGNWRPLDDAHLA